MKRSRNYSASGSLTTVESTAMSMLDPKRYAGGLPYEGGYALCTKSCSAAATINATNYPDACILWCPKRGYNSLWMMTALPVTPSLSLTLFNAYTVNFNQGRMWLPTLDASFNLTVEPAIEDTFAVSRVASACLTIESSTTSTTSAALSGVISGAAINDLRDLTTGGNLINNFTAASLAQIATTIKDSAINVAAQDGVVMYLGPDLASELKPTEYNRSPNFGHSAIERLAVPPQGVGYGYGCFGPGIYASGLAITGTCNTNPGFLSRILTLEFGADAAGKSVGIACVWATNVNGAVYYNLVNYQCQLGIPGGPYCNHDIRFDPPSINDFFAGFILDVPANCGGQIKITHVDMYDQSTLGGIRLARWENVAAGQNVSVRADIMIEGVATGAIAPYVKPDSVYSSSAFNLPLLRSLFNDPANSIIKRVYTRREATMLSVSGMVQQTASDAKDNVYKASGMFSGLGTLAGGVIGGPAGADIGRLAGGIVDAVNPLSWFSSGDTHRAAGMLGSASGMLGAPGFDGV